MKFIPAIVLSVSTLACPDLQALKVPVSPVRQNLPAPDLRTRIDLLDPQTVVPDPVRDAADATRIKARLGQLYLQGAAPAPGDTRAWVNSQVADGSWTEFDYDTFYPQFFPPFEHLKRVSGLALAYLKEDPFKGDPAIREAITRGIDFWITKAPQTRHVWFLEIGVPLELVKPLILLEAELPQELIKRAFPMLTCALHDSDYIYNGAPATGANLTWIARSAMEAALLTNDIPLAQQAAHRIADEIRVALDEGIQPDFGFYQHGKQFYAGGYGASFVHDCATAIALLDGTRFALPRERVQLLVDYILEGTRWMTRHGEWVAGSRGREITRPGGRMSPHALQWLLQVEDIPRRQELQAFAAEIAAEPGTVEPSVRGNRHFWSVDLMTQHEPAWSGFIDLTSKRIFGTEGGNKENLLGYHLVDGVVQIMKSGTEYHNIAPLWDWKKIPGTTILQYGSHVPAIDWWGDGTRGTTAFVGGLSDSERGLAVLDFQRHGVQVQKAWSVSSQWILAAGTGLKVSPGNSDNVATTVDQRYRRGPVMLQAPGGEGEEAKPGRTQLQGPVWVRHDNMGYLIPANHRATLLLDHRQAGWESVNSIEGAKGNGMEADLFTLWIDHGPHPVMDFHYMIWPDLPLDAPLPQLESLPSVRSFEGGLLVIEDKKAGLLQAAAFEAGRWELDLGVFSTSDPCVVQLKKTPSGSRLTVADPSATRERLTLSYPQQWLPELLWGYFNAPHHIELPKGVEAGNSVVADLSVVSYVKLSAATAMRERNTIPMVEVEGGYFDMGREGGDVDERPVRKVHLRAFQVSQMEITADLYHKVRDWALKNGYEIASTGQAMEGGGFSSYPGDRPVVRVDWFSAVLWCNAFSEMNRLDPVYYADSELTEVYRSGRKHLSPHHLKVEADGYRLPTEAEWEHACLLEHVLLGTMLDSVSEWCFDFYGGYPAESQVNPAGPAYGFDRVRRGGIKGGFQGGLQSPSVRLADVPMTGSGNTGFRVVRTILPQ